MLGKMGQHQIKYNKVESILQHPTAHCTIHDKLHFFSLRTLITKNGLLDFGVPNTRRPCP
jgi:hypothetical protein